MGKFKGALIMSLLACVTSYPDERLQQSIAQVLTSLGSRVDSSQTDQVMDTTNKRSRPKIITKYDFLQSRHKKSHLELPKPIVISSGIKITDPETKKESEGPNSRTGRNLAEGSIRTGRYLGGGSTRSRKAKANFAIKRALDNAPVIQGERRPDDYTDRVTHRNGRFINNVFIPNNVDVELPPEFVVNSDKRYKNRPRFSLPTHLNSIRESPVASWSFSRSARSHGQENDPINHVRGRGDRNEEKERGGRKLPFSFNFQDYYVGREQDRRDAMALESRQDEVYALPEFSSSGREGSYSPQNPVSPVYSPQSSVYSSQSTQSSQSPVYYVDQDLEDLHADRSPYMFEPADTQSTYRDQYSMGSQQSDLYGSGQTVLAASNEDFVIKEHTYQMCPGCPTFNIPIPVPRTALETSSDPINPYNLDPGYEYQYVRNKTLLQQIGDKIVATVEPIINNAKSWITGSPVPPVESNAVDRSSQEWTDGSRQEGAVDWSPMWYAGLAAAALGGATIISTLGQLSRVGGLNIGRDFDEQDVALNSIEGLDYDESDMMCLPRAYCEKLKANNKHTIDQYPNIKFAAKWLLERMFSMDQVYSKKDTPVLSECHLRECLFSLVT